MTITPVNDDPVAADDAVIGRPRAPRTSCCRCSATTTTSTATRSRSRRRAARVMARLDVVGRRPDLHAGAGLQRDPTRSTTRCPTAPAGTRPPASPSTVSPDAVPPVVSQLRDAIAAGGIGASTVPVRLSWHGADPVTGVAAYQLQQRVAAATGSRSTCPARSRRLSSSRWRSGRPRDSGSGRPTAPATGARSSSGRRSRSGDRRRHRRPSIGRGPGTKPTTPGSRAATPDTPPCHSRRATFDVHRPRHRARQPPVVQRRPRRGPRRWRARRDHRPVGLDDPLPPDRVPARARDRRATTRSRSAPPATAGSTSTPSSSCD